MEKFSQVVFFIFILFLPTQLGKHFWPEWSLVSGVRIDYLSPTVYLTDILVLLIALGFLFRNTRKTPTARYSRRIRKPESQKFRLSDLLNFRFTGFLSFQSVLIIFFLLVGYWILTVDRKWLTVYWLARYLEIPLVAFLTSEAGRIRGARGNRWTGREMPMALAIAILFSVGLGIAQMGLGKTTGWFWWLGERSFNLATPGVATMTIWGREILRPYATFGHPNALAGFIAAATVLLLQVPAFASRSPSGTIRSRLTERSSAGRQSSKFKVQSSLVAMIGVLGVILTGSRGAVAALLVAALLKVQSSKFKVQSSLVILGILVGMGILGWWGRSGISGVSGAERLALAGAAVDMWRQNWLTGVGAGQFLARLPEYLPQGFYKIQPGHNVFLLGLAEGGIGGGLVWLIGLICLIWRIKRNEQVEIWLAVLVVILVTGMADHYWLTAQQNRLLLGVILGAMISISERR